MLASRLKLPSLIICAASLLPLAADAARATPSPKSSDKQDKSADKSPLDLHWQKGPGKAVIGDRAEIVLPRGYRYLAAAETKTVLRAMGNLINDSELGLLAPAKGLAWFIVFEWDDIGYVKDDEKSDLNADLMLDRLKSGQESANERRKQNGLPPMKLLGWAQKPMYDPATHNLEWATKFECEGSTAVNYHTRRLGREGVMRISLVIDPEKMTATLPAFHSLLNGYSFSSGHTYAEFRSGDKIAEYGLTALIAGGGAAVALKFGLLQKLWKVIVVAAVAVVGFFKKLFARRNTRTV